MSTIVGRHRLLDKILMKLITAMCSDNYYAQFCHASSKLVRKYAPSIVQEIIPSFR
jgi:hypothetical protein